MGLENSSGMLRTRDQLAPGLCAPHAITCADSPTAIGGEYMLEPEGSHQQRGEADGDRQRIALEHSRRVCSVENLRSADEIPSRVVIFFLYTVLSRRRNS